MSQHISLAPESGISGFVPRWLIAALEDSEASESDSAHVRMQGALLFADISGFSKLTNALFKKKGDAGADQLLVVLNHYFGHLVEQVRSRGGEVIDFAGDALVAHWPVSDRTSLPQAALLAAASGQAMCRIMTEIPEVEGTTLGLHNAVCAGELLGARLGGRHDRWVLFFGGRAARQIGPALDLAHDGDTVLSPEAAALLGGRVETELLEGGACRLISTSEPPSGAIEGARTRSERLADDRESEPYVYAFIRRRRAQGLGRWLAEMRAVNVIFIRIASPGGGPPSLFALHEGVGRVQDALARYFGQALTLTEDDKGVVFRAAFGLPSEGHFRPEYPVECALEIHEALVGLGLESSIGVATGKLFCGEVGDAQRHKYDLNGNAMNLSARLMQQGAGVLCDEATTRIAARTVEFSEPEVRALKGFGELPTARALRVKGRGVQREAAQLCGRTRELDAAWAALDRLSEGSRSTLVYEGVAGIGKSRLVAAVVDLAESRGIDVRVAVADAASRASPYYAWRPLFRALLGAEGALSARARSERLRDRLGDQAGLAPLLNPLLGLNLPDTPETSELKDFMRTDRTARLMIELLLAECAEGALLVIEDGHWLDGASLGVLGRLMELDAPLCVLIATRPLDAEAAPEFRHIVEGAGETRIALGRLPEPAIRELLSSHLGARDLPDHLTHWIHARAHGNPFFTLELAFALRADGLLQTEGAQVRRTPSPQELEAFAPPPTVEATVTYRIDRLPERAQLTLKAASAIGMTFDLAALRSISSVGEQADPDEQLQALLDADVLDRVDEETCIFRHRITQEVAYGMLVRKQKVGIHQDLALWYEAAYAEDRAPVYPELARHWGGAREHGKALGYLDLCCAAAEQDGLMPDARRFAQEAVRVEDEAREIGTALMDTTQQGRWYRRLAYASVSMGDPPQAHTQAKESLIRLGTPAPEDKKGWRNALLKGLMVHLGHRVFPRPLWRVTGDALEPTREAAVAMTCLANSFYYVGGNPLGMIGAALLATNLARRCQIPLPVTTAYGQLALVTAGMGMDKLALYYLGEAREAADGWDTPRELSQYWLSYLVVHSAGCRWHKNDGLLDEVLPLLQASRSGYLAGPIYALLGFNEYAAGHFDRVWSMAERLEETANRHGNGMHLGWSFYLRGQILNARGDYAGGAEFGRRSEVLLDAAEDYSRFVAKGVKATALAQTGALDEALALAAELMPLLAEAPLTSFTRLEGYAAPSQVHLLAWTETGAAEHLTAAREGLAPLKRFARLFRPGRPRYHRMRGLVLLAEGEQKKGLQALERALQLATDSAMPLEIAWARRELAAAGSSERVEHEAAAREVFTALGCEGITRENRATA